MSRKKFEDTKKLIHFADNNNLPAGDKLAKSRPLQDRVNASSLECLQKIQSLMNKWYHTLVGTLQRCLFVASRATSCVCSSFDS